MAITNYSNYSPYGGGGTFAELQRRQQARPPIPDYGSGQQSQDATPTAGPIPNLPPPSGPNGSAVNPRPAPPPTGRQYTRNLQSQYENYRGLPGFSGQTNQRNAPRFNPGANPFTTPAFAYAQFNQRFQPTNAPGQGFSYGNVDLSYNPVQAPGMRETQGFQGRGSGLAPQIEQSIRGLLQNPSQYGTDQVKQSFDRLSGQIDDDFNLDKQYMEEELAKRGLSDSTIRLGRLSDLNIGRRNARTELADRLLERQALSASGDTRAAIAQALGYDASQFGQGLQGYEANRAANAQNFQQDLATRAFEGDQQAMEVLRNLDVAGFNRSSGQQGWENELNRLDFQRRSNLDQFGADMDVAGFNRDSGQQGWENALSQAGFNRQLGLDEFGAGMDSAQFDASEDQRRFGNEADVYNINRDADQQSFDQRDRLLKNLLGYEQQGFENDMSADDAEFQRWLQEYLARLQGASVGA